MAGLPKKGKSGRFDTICTAVCDRCDSSTACRLCRLEPLGEIGILVHGLNNISLFFPFVYANVVLDVFLEEYLFLKLNIHR